MEEKLRKMLEEHEVIKAVNDLFIYLDQKDWENFLNCFADEVEDDYTSIFNTEVNKVKHEDIMDRWQHLTVFDTLFHSLSNHKVEIYGNEANCLCNVYSMHFLPNDVSDDDNWIVVGRYDIHLIRKDSVWKTDKIKFTATYVTGTGVLKKLGMYNALLEKWKR